MGSVSSQEKMIYEPELKMTNYIFWHFRLIGASHRGDRPGQVQAGTVPELVRTRSGLGPYSFG